MVMCLKAYMILLPLPQPGRVSQNEHPTLCPSTTAGLPTLPGTLGHHQAAYHLCLCTGNSKAPPFHPQSLKMHYKKFIEFTESFYSTQMVQCA